MRHSIFSVALVWIITSAALCAQSPKPTELLPASTVLYAEGVDASTIQELPFVQQIVQSSLFKELWKSPDAMKLRGGITLAEVALGERLPDALGKLTGRGWAVAIDSRTKGIALWTHARDTETCVEFYKKLVSIAEADAKSKGRQLKQITYRDVDAYEFNGAVVARLEDYLLVTNNNDLAKSLVDRWREPQAKGDTLAGNARFEKFAGQSLSNGNQQGTKLARAWLDVQQIHDAGLAKQLFEGSSDNFAAELILGGMLAALRQAPAIEASLDAHDKQLHLQLAAPLTKAALGDRYDYFFGPETKGQAPRTIELGGTQANLCVYRDIAQLWQRAGDIFGQKTNDQLAQAETTLTTLFSGRDFANDILGAIGPELQVVVTEQDFSKVKAPVPQVKLPAFALVTRLRDPQAMQPQMKRIFMSLIGFANVAGAMNQQPQLDLESSRLESGWEVVATYAVEADRPKDWLVPVQYNFSPTLFMTGEYAVISSTQVLAQKIGEQLKAPAATNATAGAASAVPLNSMLRLDGDLLNRALAANRQQLISQNMVEKGHTQEEAAAEVDILLQAVQLVQSLRFAFTVNEQASIDIDLQLSSQK